MFAGVFNAFIDAIKYKKHDAFFATLTTHSTSRSAINYFYYFFPSYDLHNVVFFLM